MLEPSNNRHLISIFLFRRLLKFVHTALLYSLRLRFVVVMMDRIKLKGVTEVLAFLFTYMEEHKYP